MSKISDNPSSVEDLTAQLTACRVSHEHLQTQNLLLQASIESLHDVLLFSIDPDYRYTMFNSTFSSATHHAYGIHVAVGMSMLDSILSDEERRKAKASCDRALAGESHVSIDLYGTLTPEYFETRYSPLVDEHGKIMGVTVHSTNITERKRAEEDMQELNRELESFTYTASHDLRTPLRAIHGYAEILREDHGSELSPGAQAVIDDICRNVEKMGRLIDDLLEYSRLGRKGGAVMVLDMEAVVRAAIQDVEELMQVTAVEWTVHDLSPALGDTSLLKQVWMNLISNAVKYSSKNPHPRIEIGCDSLQYEVVYWIRDNGIGFDMQFHDKIFGVFQRLHSRDVYEGNGVGLAIVQRIVHRLGGRIWATSKVNEGACFYMTLRKPTARESR